MLQYSIKSINNLFKISVTSFKCRYDIFDRIEVSVENRISYVNYMMENPLIARRKKVNLKGLVT